jgi:trigger factor
MYSYKVKKLPKSTVEVTVDVPRQDIASEEEAAFQRIRKVTTVQGFRQGKVPSDIARKHVKKESVIQEMVRSLLPRIYEEIVKKENLKPIVSPRVELIKAKEGEDWQFKITVAEKPEVDLGNYKEEVKKAKAESASRRKADIWVPGQKEKPEESKEVQDQKVLNEVLEVLLKTAKVEIPDLLVEEEVNRRLTALVDDIQKIGLTTDAYLKTKGLTMEELKERYRKEIADTYKLELILGEIAEKEGIKIEKEDLDKLFANIKEEKEKKAAEENAYFYASVLRKQKTLDYLLGL